jgi:hypothetical protein
MTGPVYTQLDRGARVDPKQFLWELVVHVDQVAARHFQLGRGGLPASAIQFKVQVWDFGLSRERQALLRQPATPEGLVDALKYN